MAISLSGRLPAPLLITPECEAPGCSVTGDQYTMVRCHRCGAWFCPEHIDAEEGVTLVRPPSSALSSLSYYRGICARCRQASERARTREHLSPG
jgi:hypothetical protein